MHYHRYSIIRTTALSHGLKNLILSGAGTVRGRDVLADCSPYQIHAILLTALYLWVIEGMYERKTVLRHKPVRLVGGLVVVHAVQPDAHRGAPVVADRVNLLQ